MKTYGSTDRHDGLDDGSGAIASVGGALATHHFGFAASHEDRPRSDPPTTIGATGAGCVTMAVSLILADTGFPGDRLEARADVALEKIGDGFAITAVHLPLRGRVPGITADAFLDLATRVRIGGPIADVSTPVVILDASPTD